MLARARHEAPIDRVDCRQQQRREEDEGEEGDGEAGRRGGAPPPHPAGQPRRAVGGAGDDEGDDRQRVMGGDGALRDEGAERVDRHLRRRQQRQRAEQRQQTAAEQQRQPVAGDLALGRDLPDELGPGQEGPRHARQAVAVLAVAGHKGRLGGAMPDRRRDDDGDADQEPGHAAGHQRRADDRLSPAAGPVVERAIDDRREPDRRDQQADLLLDQDRQPAPDGQRQPAPPRQR